MNGYVVTAQVNLYLTCPAAYRLKYVEPLSPLFHSGCFPVEVAAKSAIPMVQPRPLPCEIPQWSAEVRLCRCDAQGVQQAGASSVATRGELAPIIERSAALLAAHQQSTPRGNLLPAGSPCRVTLANGDARSDLDVPLNTYLELLAADATVAELIVFSTADDQPAVLHHLCLTGVRDVCRDERQAPLFPRLDVRLTMAGVAPDGCYDRSLTARLIRLFLVADGLLLAM